LAKKKIKYMLSIETRSSDKQQVITIIGALEGVDAIGFREQIAKLIEQQIDSVVLDLRQLNSIDLIGYNTLVMLRKITQQRTVNLYLDAPKHNVVHEYIHLSKFEFNYIQQGAR